MAIPTVSRYTWFPTLKEFYRHRGGEWSPESDYGRFNWLDGELPECRNCLTNPSNCHDHRLRVSHVHDTGDVYAVPHADQSGDGGAVLVGRFDKTGKEGRLQANEAFENWARGETLGRPLSWFSDAIEMSNFVNFDGEDHGAGK